MTLELPFPLLGLNKSQALSKQPVLTSRDLSNVWPEDRTTGRLRGSVRPGMTGYFTGYVSSQGNKVQCITPVTYHARHLNYSADSQPNEQFAVNWPSGATASVTVAGLDDDFYAIDNNTTVRRYSRYGVELASLLLDVPADLVLRTITVATDGSVYVATSDYISLASSILSTRIYKIIPGADGISLELAWIFTVPGGGFVERMFYHDGSLYTCEANSQTPVETVIRQYHEVDVTSGPYTGTVETLTMLKFSSDFVSYAPMFVAGDNTYPHDMAMRTTGAFYFVVALGTIRNAGAGKWGLCRVAKDSGGVWDVNTAYMIASDEATANSSAPPIVCGGIGYACDVDITGNVYSMGRKNVAVGGDDVYFRKITDTGGAWQINPPGWTNRTQTTDLGGTGNYLNYGYPRMALDKYANAVVPLCRNTAGVSAAKVVKNDGTLFTSIVHFEDTSVPGVPTATPNECRTVSIPTTYPRYQTDDYKIADTVFTGGSPVDTLLTSGSTTAVLHGYDILLEVPVAGVSSRATVGVAVASGNIVKFTSSGTQTPVNSTGRSPVLSATARLIQVAQMKGELFFTDGMDYAVYRPLTSVSTQPHGEIVNWAASSLGIIPARCRLIARWRGRIVLAHSADTPFAWAMSAFDDAYNWDTDPPVVTAEQAVSFTSIPAIGATPRVINALVPWSDDLLFFGCDGLILRLDGDPMAGGQMSVVSDITGMAFGTPWCKDPEGRVYFFGDKGGVYAMSTGGELEWLTRDTIEEDLSDIDLSQYRLELTWNTRDNGLHLWVLPYGSGGAHLTHYFWSAKTQGWFPVEIGTSSATTAQPTAVCVMDGDLPADRTMILGTEDGRALKWDETASSDDGQPIDGRVTIGPISMAEEGFESKMRRLSVLMANELGGVHVKLFVSDTPVMPLIPTSQMRVGPGRNMRLPVKGRGCWCWLQLRSASRTTAGVAALSEKWALEYATADIVRGGRCRVRS